MSYNSTSQVNHVKINTYNSKKMYKKNINTLIGVKSNVKTRVKTISKNFNTKKKKKD